MSTDLSTPGLNLVKTKKRDIKRCIICQNVKDKKGSKKLTSTENGRKSLFECSQSLEDGLLRDLDENDFHSIQYHVDTCYPTYKKRAAREIEKKTASTENENKTAGTENDENVDTTSQPRSSKRIKLDEVMSEKQAKVCIICNKERIKNDYKLYRIGEASRAKNLLNASRFFKDDVHTRCIFWQKPGDVFAADVMYHGNCLNGYVKRFRRDMEALLKDSNEEEDVNGQAGSVLDEMFEKLNLSATAYHLSDLRENASKLFSARKIDFEVSNRSLKKRLINFFGESICFCYPKDKSKSQLVFSREIETTSLVDSIRSQNYIKQCAESLKNECKEYEFGLDNSFKSAEDLNASYNNMQMNRPALWETFFDYMFPYRKKSDNIRRKCDTIFQIAFSMVHNLTKVPPLHVFVAQTIHDISRSKKLIHIMNRLGISINYNEMQRIDTLLATKLIKETGVHRVPVSEKISSESVIQGAMDNFDHDENTLSGIGGSHDTVLVLFQNDKEYSTSDLAKDPDYIQLIPESMQTGSKIRSLDHILPCQILEKATNLGKRGEIPASFSVSGNFADVSKSHSRSQFKIWSVARSNIYPANDIKKIPSFTAANSLMSSPVKILTRFAFTPIIPHPATQFDTIFSCMKNFQDVLVQREQDYGPLWCDEGVYCIAKELQLLNPDLFSNIFLGLGGFHMEKILIACCGSYLTHTGMANILIEREVFGPGVVNSVMSGGNYIRGKRGMLLLGETLQRLQLAVFANSSWGSPKSVKVKKSIHDLQALFGNYDPKAQYHWTKFEEPLSEFLQEFDVFVNDHCKKSQLFEFWNTFLNDIVSVLVDLTRSHREGDWNLHLSAVRRALPLFFAFNRTHYSRWCPLYFEECQSLKKSYPEIYESFIKGGFVVSQSLKRGSKIPMDMALEKQYNKPAKGPSGVIGISRRKEAVLKWNLIRHDKLAYTSILESICGLKDEDEYSLHHEFSPSLIDQDIEAVESLYTYFMDTINPFDVSNTQVVNFVTGEVLSDELVGNLIRSTAIGEDAYKEFKVSRLEKKTSKLFDTITRTKIGVKSTENQPPPDINKETQLFLKTIDMARVRSFDIASLLQHELTSTSFYLTLDGNIRKPAKSELSRELKKLLVEIPQTVPVDPKRTAVIIDFMAYCRKVPIKKLKLKTYKDFCSNLWSTFQKLSKGFHRIDIVFDLYLDSGIKQQERNRRSKGNQVVEVTISNINQNLPVEIDKFWGSSSNKMQLEQVFIDWLCTNYKDEMPVYLGGANKDDITSCLKVCGGSVSVQRLLKCDHEEADDRILFHINHAVRVEGFQKIVVATADTDVFVNLIYHYNRWVFADMSELWVVSGKRGSQTAVPIHGLVEALDDKVVDILPAIHALTGCDTTSKVSTKLAAYQAGLTDGYGFLHSFGKEPISEQMIRMAEMFLVRCITKKYKVDTFDELRYEVYHDRTDKFDLGKFPPTSASIRLHIRRAYLQVYLWYHSPFMESIDLKPEDYGYERTEDEKVVPQISNNSSLPESFPYPCNCVKCARKTCACRKHSIPCCKYCKCSAGKDCQNPFE